MSRSITQAALAGLRWNYVGFVARGGSNFLIGIFLARLLGPKPFGQIAAASLVIGIANLVADAGFSSALIQAPSITRLQIRFVFTLQFLIAIAMSLCCAASGPWVAAMFHDPLISRVVAWISLIFVLQAVGQTANALLRRELAFRFIQMAQLASYLVGFLLVGIPLALHGAGVWSLIAAQLVQGTLFSLTLYLRVRHPVLPSFSRTGVTLLRFGAKIAASNLINYGISNADNFVVGRSFGSLALGYYSRAFTLANAPTEGIISAVQQVLFASCSRADGRLEPIRRAYLTSLAAVALVVVPAFCAMSVAAPAVLLGLYGNRWVAAVPLFRPLILALALHALMGLAGPILGSLNFVEREIRAQGICLVAAVIAFWLAARTSALALAWTVLGIYFLRFLLMTWPVLQVLGLRWRELVRALSGPALLAIGLSAYTFAVQRAALAAHVSYMGTVAILGLTEAALLVIALLFAGRWLLTAELTTLLRAPLSFRLPRVASLMLGPQDTLLVDAPIGAPEPLAGGSQPSPENEEVQT